MIKADILYNFPTVKDIVLAKTVDNYYDKMWFLGVFVNIQPVVFPRGTAENFVADKRRTFLA